MKNFMLKVHCKITKHPRLNIKKKLKEKYKPNLLCNLCKIHKCNQDHLLDCERLLWSNELVSYIPDYNEIYDDKDPEEQFFIEKIIIKNLRKKRKHWISLDHLHLLILCCWLISYGWNCVYCNGLGLAWLFPGLVILPTREK